MTRPARILHIITRLDPGGSAANTLLTLTGLPAHYRQALVYGRTRTLPPVARAVAATARMQELRELVRDVDPASDLAALGKLYRLMRRGRFELVHTHTSKAGILGRVAARLARVPRLVHTPHGHVFTGYAGRRSTAMFVLLERWAATFTDRIVGLTDQEVRDHLQRGIGKPRQFVTIPSGVEQAGYHRSAADRGGLKASLGVPPAARVIGAVGRLEPIKGHRYLIEAFGTLAPRFPDLHLVIAGDGELLPALDGAARRSAGGDRITFLGWRDDVAEVLRVFDVFVFPSLNEGMGRALVEAMAAGVPIVASRAGGIPEVLDGGKAGVLVEPASGAALARAIEQLLLDRDLGLALAAAARMRAPRYSAECMLRLVEALYRELL